MNPGAGNRQDNRQRGNAAQLLEKYKGLARDSQVQGDRVQSEFYLQFADHYFRILNESRARYEEQRRHRGDDDSSDEDDEQDVAEAAGRRGGDEDEGEGRRPARRAPNRDGNGEDRPRPRARRGAADEESDGERIAADSLPPAISGGGEEQGGEARAPRPRRPRRPRDGEEIAPAA